MSLSFWRWCEFEQYLICLILIKIVTEERTQNSEHSTQYSVLRIIRGIRRPCLNKRAFIHGDAQLSS